MIPLLLLAQALGAPSFVLDHDVLRADELPPPPPLARESWAVVDLDALVVVRPPSTDFAAGFGLDAFSAALSAALDGRETSYDVAAIVHSELLPTQFPGAAAFHLAFNNGDVSGTGDDPVLTPEVPVRSGLWLNHVNYWDSWPEGADRWVFCHEMGHQWLSFVKFDDGSGPSDLLLGRQRAHWTWFLDTPNSPMEGNAWVDNGDGTFSTDPTEPGVFSPLDLYLMGLLPAEEVPPVFFIKDPVAPGRFRESVPEHLLSEDPLTISGTRVEVSLDEILAVHGPRSSSIGHTPDDLRLLYILVVGPDEMITDELVEVALSRQDTWTAAWEECTAGRSQLFMGVIDEGWQPPPASSTPALVPRGAW